MTDHITVTGLARRIDKAIHETIMDDAIKIDFSAADLDELADQIEVVARKFADLTRQAADSKREQ